MTNPPSAAPGVAVSLTEIVRRNTHNNGTCDQQCPYVDGDTIASEAFEAGRLLVSAAGEVSVWVEATINQIMEVVDAYAYACQQRLALEKMDEKHHDVRNALCAALLASTAEPMGDVVISKDDRGQIVAVTRQNDEGRILSIIAESDTLAPLEPKRSVQSSSGGGEPEPVAWEPLVEIPRERQMFDQQAEHWGVQTAIATCLSIWASMSPGGSYAAQCAIMANEVAKLYAHPPVPVRAPQEAGMAVKRPAFEREHRYVVFKVSDIKRVPADKAKQIYSLAEWFDARRMEENRSPMTCLVIEHDWPEYEPAWAAIQQRMENTK